MATPAAAAASITRPRSSVGTAPSAGPARATRLTTAAVDLHRCRQRDHVGGMHRQRQPAYDGGGIYNNGWLMVTGQHHRRGRCGQHGQPLWRRHLQRGRHDDGGWQHRQRQHGRPMAAASTTGPRWTVQNGSTIGGAGAGNTATADGGGIYNLSAARRRWTAAPSAPTRPTGAAASITRPR